MGKAGLSGQNFWGEAVFRTENVAATHGWGFLLALLRSGLQFYHVSPAQLTPRCDLASACDSSVHRRVHRDLCRRQGATRVKVVWGSSTRDCLQRWGKLGQQRQSSARKTTVWRRLLQEERASSRSAQSCPTRRKSAE